MIKSILKEAKADDAPAIVSLLVEMQNELGELNLSRDVVLNRVNDAIAENVVYFIFLDEHNNIFGTCHLQSVHNYWSAEKRYYLGGFYITPSHRHEGRFRIINNLLKEWISSHNGVQVYAHIHKDNHKSIAAFGSVDMKPVEYSLCVYHWGE